MGDFAYWYRRAPGVPIMDTGMIAQLANPAEGNGRALLVRDDAPGTGRYGVVSDGVVLLRGGYVPETSEEEGQGHWIAKVGEVPVRVRGTVDVNDRIGPVGDGSGMGMVKADARNGDVVGFAVDGKQDPAPGPVTVS